MRDRFLKSRYKAFGHAFNGIAKLIKSETHFQIELGMAVAITLLGFIFEITSTEWLIQTGMIGLVLCAEAFNSSLEELADVAHPEKHPKIKKVKDIAAGAVLLTAIVATIIGLMIYIPYVF